MPPAPTDHHAAAKGNISGLITTARRIDDAASAQHEVDHDLRKTRWWDKAAIGTFEQTGEGKAAPVAVLRADDLHADR